MIEVADLRQLQDIMSAIRAVPDVINVERVRGNGGSNGAVRL